MPRQPRLDIPGLVHHVMARGIERTDIFRDDRGRETFVDRLGELVLACGAALYGCAPAVESPDYWAGTKLFQAFAEVGPLQPRLSSFQVNRQRQANQEVRPWRREPLAERPLRPPIRTTRPTSPTAFVLALGSRPPTAGAWVRWDSRRPATRATPPPSGKASRTPASSALAPHGRFWASRLRLSRRRWSGPFGTRAPTAPLGRSRARSSSGSGLGSWLPAPCR